MVSAAARWATARQLYTERPRLPRGPGPGARWADRLYRQETDAAQQTPDRPPRAARRDGRPSGTADRWLAAPKSPGASQYWARRRRPCCDRAVRSPARDRL